MGCSFLRIADFYILVRYSNFSEGQFKLPSQYSPFLISDIKAGDKFLFEFIIDNSVQFVDKGNFQAHFNSCGNHQYIYLNRNGSYFFELKDKDNCFLCCMQCSPDFSKLKIALSNLPTMTTVAFNHAMMIAFAFASARYGTILMHASSIVYKDRGLLFLGESGTGKSTHSQLWLKNFNSVELLNDDNPVVRISDGHAVVYGTPWSGKTPCYKQKNADIQAFVLLEQKKENQIERLNTLQAFASLLTATSMMVWNKKLHGFICQSLSDLLRLIPVYHLGCLPDNAAAFLCKETIVQ